MAKLTSHDPLLLSRSGVRDFAHSLTGPFVKTAAMADRVMWRIPIRASHAWTNPESGLSSSIPMNFRPESRHASIACAATISAGRCHAATFEPRGVLLKTVATRGITSKKARRDHCRRDRSPVFAPSTYPRGLGDVRTTQSPTTHEAPAALPMIAQRGVAPPWSCSESTSCSEARGNRTESSWFGKRPFLPDARNIASKSGRVISSDGGPRPTAAFANETSAQHCAGRAGIVLHVLRRW